MSLSPFVPTRKFEDYRERFKDHFRLERDTAFCHRSDCFEFVAQHFCVPTYTPGAPNPPSRCTNTRPFAPIRTHSISGRENSVVQIGLSIAGHL